MMRDGFISRLTGARGSKRILSALIGPRGTGKTQLAVDVMQGYARRTALSVKYVKLFGMALEIKESFDSKTVSERDVILKYSKPHFLVIDEIHEKLDSDWARSIFTHLIDLRYDDMKSTIMIGNVEVDEFEKIVGASVYSRLKETGGVVNCNWKSFRTKEGERC